MAQNDKVVEINNQPKDPLNELLKQGTRDLLAKAVQAELTAFLNDNSSFEVDGKQSSSEMATCLNVRFKRGSVSLKSKCQKCGQVGQRSSFY